MTALTFSYTNSNDQSVYIQVDPWAGVYELAKGQTIELVAYSDSDTPLVRIEEYRSTRILLIANSSEYYVIRDGKKIHWSDYLSDKFP